jgi:murein DD-endopeptidase MepM/ murein hydrolase activator NlpD
VLYPVRARIGSRYGWRRLRGRDDLHTGIDFAAPAGELVRAAATGTVRLVAAPGEWQSYGRIVVLEHPGNPAPLYTLYAHLQSSAVQRGELVQAGQPIATVGDTAGTRADPDARTSAPHLHFELLTAWPPSGIDRDRIDPTPYLNAQPGELDWRELAPAAARGAGWALAAILLALAWSRRNRSAGEVSPAGARSSQRYLFGTRP